MAVSNDKTWWQPPPNHKRKRKHTAHPHRYHWQGFTLLEVLVAMVLLSAGLAIAFTAISGSTQLDGKATAHGAAMALARAKLDEVLNHPDYVLATDAGEERFAGMDLGYRIQIRPVPLLEPAQLARLTELKQVLQEVEIEVFWGPKGAQQSYQLSSYRLDGAPPVAASNAAAGSPPAGAIPAAKP